MEMNETPFGRTNSGPPLRPRASGFVQNVVKGINRLEERATATKRKKFVARTLPEGKDIFHGFEFPPPPSTAPTKTAGRKPYNWTPKRSRELIKLIIHTDLKFDDISTAMKDEAGEGPSETTCRNHWHEIFGYSPDAARLKFGQGRERRLREHLEAYDAHRKKMKTLQASTVAAELNHLGPRFGRLSRASSTMEQSRTSSVYADSGIQVNSDSDSTNNNQPNNEIVSPSQDLPPVPDFHVTPAAPSEFVNNSAPAFEGYSLRPGLSTVQEDGESPDHITRPSSPNPAPSEISPEDQQEMSQERRASKFAATKTVAHIEEKEDLPSGFISWIRKISLNSTPESRHPSTASYASRTSLRFSRSVRNSVATSLSMGFHQERVPRDAICKYLGNNSALVEPSPGYVEELIQRGADVNAKNARGETPLHFAVGRGAIAICTILLENRADATAKSYAGESIWDFGRRVSKNTLDPDGKYDKAEQLLRTMVAARIEFLRATVKFNPELVVEEPDRTKRRRNSDQNAWSRSGASGAGSGGGRKKSKMPSPLGTSASPQPARSPSTSQPTPEPTPTPTGNRAISNEPTPQVQVAAGPSHWQHPTMTEQPAQTFAGQGHEASYFPEQTTYPMYENHTHFTEPFSNDAVDPLFTGMPPGFLDQEYIVDPHTFDPIGIAPTSSYQEDTATLHANQNIGYMTGNLNDVQQSYVAPSAPEQQQYTRTSLPDQQYSHPSPPCPEGTVSPAQLSMAASPSHLSMSASPGQYFSDYTGQSERGNSDASTIEPVVVPAQPTYVLPMEQTVQGTNVCLPHSGQAFNTGYSMTQYPEQMWAAYQQQQQQTQNQCWAQGGYAQ